MEALRKVHVEYRSKITVPREPRDCYVIAWAVCYAEAMGLNHKTIDIIFNVGLVGVIIFCASATAYSLVVRGLGAEAAAWVQAGGSIAALSGAAWLAKVELRRRNADRRSEREEAAWALHFALQQAHREANVIAWEIVGPEANPSPEDRRHWRLRTRVARQVLTSNASSARHFHPALIHTATNAIALLDQMDEDLDTYHGFLVRGEEPETKLIEDITWYVGHFEQLMEELKARMRGIVIEIDKTRDGVSSRRPFWEDDATLSRNDEQA